jgi:nitrogen PTS system EIIA component
VDIEQLLSPADVLVGLRASSKREVLQALTQHLATRLGCSPHDVLSAILKREDLGSTGIGAGVAVPHARLTAVQRPAGALARLTHPVPFDAVDEQAVDLVFLVLLSTSSEGNQLNALACAARTLRDVTVRTNARRATDRSALYAALTTRPEGLRHPR